MVFLPRFGLFPWVTPPPSPAVAQNSAGRVLQKLSQGILEAAQEAHAASVKGMQEKMQGLARSLGLPTP